MQIILKASWILQSNLSSIFSEFYILNISKVVAMFAATILKVKYFKECTFLSLENKIMLVSLLANLVGDMPVLYCLFNKSDYLLLLKKVKNFNNKH